MTQATGAQSKLLLGFQADIDTIATEGFVMPINRSTLNASKSQNSAATIRGNLNPVEPFDGNLSSAGQITVPVDSVAFWYWLKAIFGSPTTSGTDPYDHVYKAGTTRPYLTIEHQFTDLGTAKYFQYKGCKVASFSMSGGGDGELVANIDVAGASRTIASSSFDASPTTLTMSRLKNNQMTLKEGGSTISNAKMIDLSVNFNVDTSQYVIGGGGVLGSIPDGVMSVSGNLSTLFEDTTLLDKAINSTESSAEVTVSAGASSALVIELTELKYTPRDPGIEGPQGLSVNLPFNCYYDNDADETSVKTTLTNGDAHA